MVCEFCAEDLSASIVIICIYHKIHLSLGVFYKFIVIIFNHYILIRVSHVHN